MTPNEFGQVRYGVEMYSMKEEDFFKMQCLNNKTMFGVFDGHGGKFVARKCAEYDWGNEQSFEEIFWKLDENLGPQSLNSGTTASIMMIECVPFSTSVLKGTQVGIARVTTSESVWHG